MKQKLQSIYHVTRSHQSAFTLLEMIIVIFIIIIIASLSIANYRKGERQRRVAIAADIVTNAIRSAQNYSLTSRQIPNTICPEGNAPSSHLIYFGPAQQIVLYGVDKCDNTYPLETYALPANTRIQSGGYKLNSVPVSALQFRFVPPFAQLTASSSATLNFGTFSNFTNATITMETTAAEFPKTVLIDGVSGRIGE